MTLPYHSHSLLRVFLIGLILTGLFTVSASAKERPLFVEAVDYKTIENVEGCEVEPYHKERKFPQCTDPEKLYASAREFALEQSLPLVIYWGFDECPGCSALEKIYLDPNMLPTNKAVAATLPITSKKVFSDYTKGKNQIALVRMNSHASFAHFMKFADRIGATKAASNKGWNKVWSPLFMVMNPKTEAIAVNDWFSGYRLCGFIEEISIGLGQVGVLGDKFNGNRLCYMNAEHTDDDLEKWKKACKSRNTYSCFWLGFANQVLYERAEDKSKPAAKKFSRTAKKYMARSCEIGLVTACRQIAYDEADQHNGVPTKNAIFLLEKACRAGDADACGILGYAYVYGQGGLKRNAIKGMRNLERACDSHIPWACAAIGEFAINGELIARHHTKHAKNYISFACREGHDWACELK